MCRTRIYPRRLYTTLWHKPVKIALQKLAIIDQVLNAISSQPYPDHRGTHREAPEVIYVADSINLDPVYNPACKPTGPIIPSLQASSTVLKKHSLFHYIIIIWFPLSHQTTQAIQQCIGNESWHPAEGFGAADCKAFFNGLAKAID
ncbi:uncharacterized protein CLUP02_17659 [Colletotrichum lupini]|uniref:Uncharacterized protein n=1 Tax=Colletotrichum lupini TaxID=145971 RepID=A0A9Q8WA03_9PEZI|nr:uncharacterized protein CLUP02_17659 [Colletotrichum lupini]UQC76148.1 hypothetical protein CLUP02_17659 [Colletotrichum lupini]